MKKGDKLIPNLKILKDYNATRYTNYYRIEEHKNVLYYLLVSLREGDNTRWIVHSISKNGKFMYEKHMYTEHLMMLEPYYGEIYFYIDKLIRIWENT